jgi:hypothetical protein
VRGDRDDGEGHQAGLGHGQQHVPDDRPPRRAIDGGSLLEVARQGEEGLAHQEGAEGRGEVWRHHAGQRVVEAEIDHGAQVGHDQRRRHQHELQQEGVEQKVASGKTQAGEGISGKAHRHALHGEDARDHDDGVDVVEAERAAIERVAEILQGRMQVGQQGGHVGAARALGPERGDEGP